MGWLVTFLNLLFRLRSSRLLPCEHGKSRGRWRGMRPQARAHALFLARTYSINGERVYILWLMCTDYVCMSARGQTSWFSCLVTVPSLIG
jgi:hypothetical protein